MGGRQHGLEAFRQNPGAAPEGVIGNFGLCTRCCARGRALADMSVDWNVPCVQ
jgi:hypothetical protein